jgi:hypothetical protein
MSKPKKKESEIIGWTLVRHSAWAFGGNPQFLRAVEVTAVTEGEAEIVRSVNGFLFDDYKEASDREMFENYPEHVEGLIPQVEGYFHKARLEGSEIYIPKEPTD